MSKTSSQLPSEFKFGWVPDVPDRRDFMFKVTPRPLTALDQSVDLSPLTGPVLNQGQIGSCTAFASLAAFHVAGVEDKLRIRVVEPSALTGFSSRQVVRYLSHASALDQSELFQYYETRKLHNTVMEDSGGSIRNAIKALGKTGVCTEGKHPYAATVHAMTRPPSPEAYSEAAKFKALKYERVDNRVAGFLYEAVNKGRLVVFGSMLYESFMATKDVVKMPTKREKALGGHAMTIVGHDIKTKRFLVKNSWGTGWALKGYHWMPEAYLTDTNLSDDFWTISSISVGK
jgi:C1A family cysteine protease